MYRYTKEIVPYIHIYTEKEKNTAPADRYECDRVLLSCVVPCSLAATARHMSQEPRQIYSRSAF
jgi:hypothetical protein